jgi:hypothetical protein
MKGRVGGILAGTEWYLKGDEFDLQRRNSIDPLVSGGLTGRCWPRRVFRPLLPSPGTDDCIRPQDGSALSLPTIVVWTGHGVLNAEFYAQSMSIMHVGSWNSGQYADCIQ